jgi:hypothetical protein
MAKSTVVKSVAKAKARPNRTDSDNNSDDDQQELKRLRRRLTKKEIKSRLISTANARRPKGKAAGNRVVSVTS